MGSYMPSGTTYPLLFNIFEDSPTEFVNISYSFSNTPIIQAFEAIKFREKSTNNAFNTINNAFQPLFNTNKLIIDGLYIKFDHDSLIYSDGDKTRYWL